MTLHPDLLRELRALRERLEVEDGLLTPAQLHTFHVRFDAEFGPERLRALDGVELLETMHGHGDRDSLVYWLEFKDDDQFPTRRFGSIGGGSALKFGLYRRKETGTWMAGSSRSQLPLEVEDAVVKAREHRDELLRAVDVLERFPARGKESDYVALQADLDRVAPAVSDSSWGHKYLSLLFPDTLEPFHTRAYQDFHLVKVLEVPPGEPGRYVAAGRYAVWAEALGWSLHALGAVLTARHGGPRATWRLAAGDAEDPRRRWPTIREGACLALGWPDVGDLNELSSSSRRAVQARVSQRAPHEDARVEQRLARELHWFVSYVREGDRVLVTDGEDVLGVGVVEDDTYRYVAGDPYPHRRSVRWEDLSVWSLPAEFTQRTTLEEVRDPEVLVELERRALERVLRVEVEPSGPVTRLGGVAARIQQALERKRQVILYGPPGTGKTYWAEATARDLASLHAFGRTFAGLEASEREAVVGGGGAGAMVRLCSFHPSLGYEDFMEGYRPAPEGSGVQFVLRDGLFKELCREAQRRAEVAFYLVIDEINRGDLPRIFGELLTVLEVSRRGREVTLPLSGERFAVPDNVYVLGTMNTADRSIALLDAALRRRFAFLELLPDPGVLRAVVAGGLPLGSWLAALNERILAHVGRDARNLQVGHAYFLEEGRPVRDFARVGRILREDVVPLLEEYCYEDFGVLREVLGEGLVDARAQRIRHELFEPGRQEELLAALLEPTPELSASSPAVRREVERARETEGDREDAAE